LQEIPTFSLPELNADEKQPKTLKTNTKKILFLNKNQSQLTFKILHFPNKKFISHPK